MSEPQLGNGIGAEGGQSSTQQKLAACVERISREEGVPPFGQHANELIARTLDLDGGSSGALARVVLKDLGLTSQILRAANSALYNRSGRPIMSVPHGIVLMGWDTLRNLVGTIRYIEHFANRSPGLRELTLLSLLSAVHSRDIAVSIGYPRPEEAHICGLFRNLGEVLIACHCPEEYSKTILTMHEANVDERTACLRVLGFSWDAVGLRVAAGWDMPPKIDVCLRGSGGLAGSPMDRCLASITDYARDLTHAMYRDGAAIWMGYAAQDRRVPARVGRAGGIAHGPLSGLDYGLCARSDARDVSGRRRDRADASTFGRGSAGAAGVDPGERSAPAGGRRAEGNSGDVCGPGHPHRQPAARPAGRASPPLVGVVSGV